MKVAVGLSGGVDSAVTALLLRERGYEVVGYTMTLGRADECVSLREAREAADRLSLPLVVCDLADSWRSCVLDGLRASYLSGRTPNPCVTCNENVKMGLLPVHAFADGCDLFATGHYARTEVDSSGGVRLLRAVDRTKDQSYFLYRVSRDVLARTVFPLGGLMKSEVRARARASGWPVADRGDSQDFCGGDPLAVIGASNREGDIVDSSGKVLGRHKGFWHYTVGKRKGLGIGGGTPYYVLRLDAARNAVVVGFREEACTMAFPVTDVVWLRPAEDWAAAQAAGELRVKVRSAGEPRGPVSFEDGLCRPGEAMSGVAPGQSAVFYHGDEVLGGGFIAAQ